MPLLRAATAVSSLLDGRPQRVLTEGQLASLLRRHGMQWGLGSKSSLKDFVEFLLARTPMRRIELRSAKYASITRYAWGNVSRFEVAAAIARQGYFCHGTAMELHGLGEATSQTVYVNREQSAKRRVSAELSQAAIQRAFARPQRVSSYLFSCEDYRILLLSGKHTHKYGVMTISDASGIQLKVSNLERTLVDIAVRPAYAGGVERVQAAFDATAAQLSVPRLVSTLGALAHVYPYHQAIGFYLQRSGLRRPALEPLRALGIKYDFYLAHGIDDPAYDSEWRVFYPK